MSGFINIQLEPNEEMVFGPVTTTRSVSVGGAPRQEVGAVPIDQVAAGGQLTHASGRTVGVTSQRVIIEDLDDPEKSQTIPNDQVQKVFISTKQRQGQSSLTINKVETLSGQSVKLDLKGLPGQTEVKIKEVFPQAEVVYGKGGKGGKAVAIIIGVGFFLLCIVPILVLLGLRLFGN
jgi:hypothetical protein